MPPCWWRRRARARRPGFRWCWPASPGRRRRKILVLEPRRLAARAAAERMARTLGERVGDTVGYRVRFGSKVSRRTRIEVVTEGVFTRLILDDPGLDGVAAVLFDEFHERSLDADLGLALTRDAQEGLREDLRILVMSATIDGARIAKALGDAPGDRERGPGISGRDPLRRPRPGKAHRGAGRGGDRARAAGRCRLDPRVPAGRRGDPAHRDAAARSRRRSRRRHLSPVRRARCRRPGRSDLRRRRRGTARSCWRPRSRRPRSPSTACAW